MIKKTYIPGKPRNPKLGTATGTSGVGKTEFNQVAGSSHEHYNKGVLDQITEAMLVGALRDLITSTDTESELTDENILSSLRVLDEITKNNETFLEDLKERFLSKINPDTAQKLITFIEGIEVGAFTTGALGSGAAVKMVDGSSYAEVDNLTVRQKATFRELIIESLKHIGGQLVLTPARMKCTKVVDGGTYYKCYFDTGDGEVSNEFVSGDFARCQVFTGSGTKFYWRLVTLVGEDWINISKTSAAVGSDAPEAGDDITQLGNATDTTRQSAIILSTVGIDAPSWKQYSGINSFSLEGKETTVFSKLGNRISGETVFTSGGANLDDYLDGVAQDIQDALTAAQDAEDKAQQAIEDAEANVATINTEVGKLQAQLDGEVSNWFYAYSPTLANYPASDWNTNVIKDRHVGDTFTNTAQAPATNAGKSWRFVKNGSVYSWTQIADSDAVKALLEVSKAQAAADGKSTTYLFQPTKYKLGDMWVLNADQTVNGTLYKQGDLLTATQNSESFVQSHWLKRVRYTDDTAVDNLQVNNRNYIRSSRLDNLTGWSTTNGTRSIVTDPKFENVVQWERTAGTPADFQKEFALVEKSSFEGAPITLFVIAKKVSASGFFYFGWNGYTRFIDSTSSNTNQIDLGGGWFVFWSSGTGSATLTNSTYFGINTMSGTWQFYAVGFNVANKYSGWQLSNEDVQASIDAAKQEALDASNNVQANVNDLSIYVDGSFKNGIIDSAEAKAIEKYLNTLSETKLTLDASYIQVHGNTYLEGSAKSNLLSAKNALNTAYTNLITSINTAIADGETTVAEKNDVDTKFGLFNTALATYQTRLEEAGKAIQAKLDAISKGYVDNLQIGGKNLLVGSKDYSLSNPLFAGSTGTDAGMDENFWVITIGTAYLQINIPSKIAVGERFTFSLIHTRRTTSAQDFQITYGSNIKQFNSNSDVQKLVFTAVKTSDSYLRISRVGGGSGWTLRVDEFQLEKGDKATDFGLANEDTGRELLEAQGYMRARYVRDWLKGNSDHNTNNWSEIKVVNKAGVNLALGLPADNISSNGTWHASYPKTNVIDGNTSTQGYITQTTPTENYVQIDLGQIYHDIEYIGVWHAGWPTRLYYGTKTQISEDGITWKTIFDSAVSGTYVETEGGKVHTQRYASVMDRIAETEAKTRFQTLIDGGLIYTALMKLFDTISGDETAFISGKQGAGKNLPAFGAGGSYQDALAGTAKAIIRHDGSSKFEETQVSGSIIAKQGSSGMETRLDSSGIRVFNATGQMNIRFGMKSGYAVLEYFDNAGTFLYDLGPNGLMKMDIREEKWTVFKRISLGTNITTIVNSTNRNKYKMSWQQTETTYYVYTSKIVAGVNQDPTNDGAIFTSMNKTGARMPLGFYCRKMPLNNNEMYMDASGGNPNQVINSQLPYIQSGNEDVYDRNNICFMDLEYYVNGKRSTSLYYAYWNETP